MTLSQFIASKPFGFLTRADLARLVALEPLCPVLLRFHQGRLVCSAQDGGELITRLCSSGWDLRDVSITADRIDQARDKAKGNALSGNYCSERFNEADCSGAFDGRQVTSDADPGL